MLESCPQYRRRRLDWVADLAAEFQKAGAGKDVGLIVAASLRRAARFRGIFLKDI